MEILKVLGAMNCGGFLLDDEGRVLSANDSGERLLGGDLDLRHGRLVAPNAEANGALQDLIKGEAACGRPRPTAAMLHRPEGLPLVARALPVAPGAGEEGESGRVLVLVIDPEECPEPSRRAFERAGFTLAGPAPEPGFSRFEASPR